VPVLILLGATVVVYVIADVIFQRRDLAS
jgi:ABC-type transport system involved in multi-copper enzyme maturation permease subunit